MTRAVMLADRLLIMACAAGLAASLLLAATGALAQAVLINNGLAPPNPDNVLDGSIDYSANRLRIRNVGCPPGWPAADPDDPCPSPGDPTTVAVEDGGEMLMLIGYDSSNIQLNGGLVTVRAELFNASSLEITGGAIAGRVDAYDDALVTMSGGSVGLLFGHDNASIILSGGSILPSTTPALLAGDDSVLTIVGTGFEVDDVAVSYGDLAENSGVLTGTLLEGDALHAIFRQASPTYSGTITLVPEPSTALLLGSGLMGLLALGRRRGARRARR